MLTFLFALLGFALLIAAGLAVFLGPAVQTYLAVEFRGQHYKIGVVPYEPTPGVNTDEKQ